MSMMLNEENNIEYKLLDHSNNEIVTLAYLKNDFANGLIYLQEEITMLAKLGEIDENNFKEFAENNIKKFSDDMSLFHSR